MRFMTLALAAIVFAQSPRFAAAQAPDGQPVLQIGVFGYKPDGSGGSAAYDTEPALESRVYASGRLCQVGAGYREAPAWAMHAWRFTGRVVSKTSDEVVVHVTWQRTLDSGNELPSSEQTIQLTLRPGDRVPLDTVPAVADSPCASHVGRVQRRGSCSARWAPTGRRCGRP